MTIMLANIRNYSHLHRFKMKICESTKILNHRHYGSTRNKKIQKDRELRLHREEAEVAKVLLIIAITGIQIILLWFKLCKRPSSFWIIRREQNRKQPFSVSLARPIHTLSRLKSKNRWRRACSDKVTKKSRTNWNCHPAANYKFKLRSSNLSN